MTIRNTTEETNRDPLGFILQAASSSTTDAILMQESQGQREVVNSTQIPTDMHCKPEELEALGFVLGPVNANDPMFREATLPDGWQREGSDHAMWSYIVDEREFRRVAIFYKAAFYDRSAHLSIQREPTTRAQDDSYEAFSEWCPFGGWVTENRKEGDNFVRSAKQAKLDADGRKVYDHSANGYETTGIVRERVIAPDGSTVTEREFVVG